MPTEFDLADVLTHRPMVSVRLPEWSGSIAPVITSLRSVDRLPEELSIDMPMQATDAVRLLDDPTANAGVKKLHISLCGFPNLLLHYAASLPRLHALSLLCTIPEGAMLDARGAPMAAGWVELPMLRSLDVEVRHEAAVAGTGAQDEAFLRWILTAVASPRAAPCLTELHLSARIPPEPELDMRLVPLVAAAAKSLRSVKIGVCPLSDDGVGKRRRMAAALSAALPNAKVAVIPVPLS
eukprot:TRINITY_DN2579_c0_g2_i1.p4 TRINITY_DN2579_c0_g2~~TRINITY_DN2579_c0_g2_i1.p4  ORF type:complete len:238 (-),score=68.05 TRINITY_DN2579_c0_g2_i1:423-1136(-)